LGELRQLVKIMSVQKVCKNERKFAKVEQIFTKMRAFLAEICQKYSTFLN